MNRTSWMLLAAATWFPAGCTGTTEEDIPRQSRTEAESNDTTGTAQNLGVLSALGGVQVTGRLESGGISQGEYTGDQDQYLVQVGVHGWVVASVAWEGSADVDLLVTSLEGRVVGKDDSTGLTASVRRVTAGGAMIFNVVSADAAADYVLTVDLYPNEVVLEGTWSASTAGGSFTTYAFTADGLYDKTLALPATGEIYNNGAYSVSSGSILMGNNQDGWDVFDFARNGDGTITIGGSVYSAN